MARVFVTKRERLDLIQQGDDMFLEVQERLYDAKMQCAAPEKDKIVTSLETFTVYGTLDAVTDLYLKDDVKMVLDFAESRELIVLKPNTKQRPLDRTSLRWSLFHLPSRLLGKDQDFCYLEVMKPFGTADGRRGWARCSNSITHKAFSALQSAQRTDVNRAELFYCGLFFEETDQLGRLNVTVFYNIKGHHATSILAPRVLKAQSKRTIELVNHYLKMSAMMLKSRKVSLTRALQLQAERRCGACANYLSIWKCKERCALCRSLMCNKCNDIVSRNYRVKRVTREQVVCFSCAHWRGTKIGHMAETKHNNLQDSSGGGLAVKTQSNSKACQEKTTQDESIFPWSNEDHSNWFDDEAKPSFVLAQENQVPQQSKPCEQKPFHQNLTPTRHSEFVPHETLRLPTERAEHHRRRCNTRVSTRRPSTGVDDDFIAPRQRRATGNSRLSARAKSTSCAGSQICGDNADFTPVGSQVNLDLEDLNWQMRRCRTNSVPVQPMELTDEGRRDSKAFARYQIMLDGTRQYDRSCQPRIVSQRPFLVANLPTRTSYPQPSLIRYSKANPCDLSYLASFKLTTDQNDPTQAEQLT
ncbi:unnamed protein product [Peronospora belbahrii]|uniref:FYVE-type domain-containing protein n=1 Tax=Peronospora belbahrii TaxID=622444 RepID=A0AAU9LAY5_9STRA|nr:unnamed protein product [Peronospora belbahrii]